MPTPLLPQPAATTAARDLLRDLAPSAAPSRDHADAFAQALADARSRQDVRRPGRDAAAPRATTRPDRDRAPRADRADPSDQTDRADRADQTDRADRADASGRADHAQGAEHARAADHADEHPLDSEGVPFATDRPATPAVDEAVDQAVDQLVEQTDEAAPDDVETKAETDAETDAGVPDPAAFLAAVVPMTPVVPAVPAEGAAAPDPTGSGSTEAPESTAAAGPDPVGAVATTAPATSTTAAGPTVTDPASAAPVTATGTAQDAPAPESDPRTATATATDRTAAPQATADSGTQGQQSHEHGGHQDHGRHLGQAARTETGRPLVVGRELGAAGGQHLGRTAGPRADVTEPPAAPTGPSLTGLAGTPAPTGTSSASAAASASTSATAPVSVPDQVFTDLGRLVRRGDGTHRLTIKLQPEALGEVRVVLTVRDGDVSVRLSGSDAAQRALLQGASDLQRLLESVGAKSAQVLVGDPGTQGQQPGTGWAQQHPGGGSDGSRGTRTPSYARPDATPTPDPTPTRARTGRSVLDVTV